MVYIRRNPTYSENVVLAGEGEWSSIEEEGDGWQRGNQGAVDHVLKQNNKSFIKTRET